MGHHENAIYCETRYTLWLKRIDKHRRRLRPSRRMRQDTSASDEQVEVHHLDQTLTFIVLIKYVGKSSLRLYPFEADG